MDTKKGHLQKKSADEEPSGKHEGHVKKLDSGYHVTKTHPDGSETEHSAADLDEAMDHMQDHFNAADVAENTSNEDAGAPDDGQEPQLQK